MSDYLVVQKVRLKQVRDGRIRFKVHEVKRPGDAYEAVRGFYRQADREILSILCLDAQNQPTCFNVVSMGDLNTTRTAPRDILKAAVLSNAHGVLLLHNHPSGCLEPSEEDVEFTKAVKRACEVMGIELYDHLIVADTGYTSLRERGVL